MKQECIVHMLPTKDKSNINLYLDKLYLKAIHHDNDIPFGTQLIPMPSEVSIPQHLYITIPQEVEPIKEGDWYYSSADNHIRQSKEDCMKRFKGSREKIIATTNKKLRIQTFRLVGGTTFPVIDIQIPQIPQSFIKEYCDKGGIDAVMIGYVRNNIEVTSTVASDGNYEGNCIQCNKYHHWMGINGMTCKHYTLKLNSDNTIIISPLEEKIYSTSDVVSLIRKYALEEHLILDGSSKTSNWIKENL